MTLYLGGGGSADDEALLWREMLAPGMRVVVWPFALEPSSYAEGLRWVESGAGRVAPVEVTLWADLGGRGPADLEGVDLVWVMGGNTYRLLDHVERNGWRDVVGDWVAAGGAYYGGSAGAVLAGADIDVARFADPNDVELDDTTGLRLLGSAVVRPHWTGVAAERAEAEHWVRERGWTVLAVPDDGGLVVADGHVRSTGPGTAAVVDAEGLRPLLVGEQHHLA